MRWYHYVAYFFGGAFLANTQPHELLIKLNLRLRYDPGEVVKFAS
jgi:hypothetical protein